MIKPTTLAPFKHFCVTIGEIPSSYLESMTYYELLNWFCDYLQNTVIPAVNTNAEAVEEIQTLFIELKNYVDNYFDNLDVQQEINNKLDEMVDDGTLQEIIGSYLNSKAVFGFDTVEAMKEGTNLIDGSYAKTLGFYEISDLGGATYKIRTKLEEDTPNELNLIAIGDDLVAELVLESTMNVEQFGAYGDNENDDTDSIQLAINNCSVIKLNKTYKTSSQITINKTCSIIGNGTINSTLTGKISVFKVLHSNVKFDGISINLTYNGGGTTGEHGNVISIGTYKMDSSMNLENIDITNCRLIRSGTLSYNVGIFGDSHNINIKNNYIYGECVNLHWSGDFDERYPDTGLCSITFHPYNVVIENNVLENNCGVFISAGYDIKVLNNQFINNTTPLTISIGDYGNTMAGSIQKSSVMTGIEIDNCSFYGYENQAVIFQGFGYRQDDSLHQKNYITTSKVNIKNCTFGETTNNPSQTIIGITNFYGITIEQCKFDTVTRLNGIYASPMFDCNFTNNIFNIPGHPFSIFGGENIIIKNNKGVVTPSYNFIRATQYTFDFTGLTYKIKNLVIDNNLINNANVPINLAYTTNAIITNNKIKKCTRGIHSTTDNHNFTILYNDIDDDSSTLQTTHNMIELENIENVNVAFNKLRGGRGVHVKSTASLVRINSNSMIDNGYASGILIAIDSRTNKDVYLINNIASADTTMVYGNYYSYVNFTEIF